MPRSTSSAAVEPPTAAQGTLIGDTFLTRESVLRVIQPSDRSPYQRVRFPELSLRRNDAAPFGLPPDFVDLHVVRRLLK